MREILIGLFIAIFGGGIVLYLEYCFFSTDSCPFQSSSVIPLPVIESPSKPTPFIESVQAADSTDKQRLVNETLVDDYNKPTPVEPSINPFSFKISYLYRAGGKGAFKHFGDGSVLHSGDHLKLMFTPTEDNVYVYIFLTDSHNNIARLFPTDDFKGAAKTNKNPSKKGVQYFVPAAYKSFQLDDNIGEETIYLIATRKPDEILESQYKDMLLAQQANNIEKITFTQTQLFVEIEMKAKKQRLINPELIEDVPQNTPVTFEEQGQTFSVLPQYLKNMCQGCVYQVTFQHR